MPRLDPEIWYNRVEGGHLGARAGLHLWRRLGLFAKGGYAAAPERWFRGAGVSAGTTGGPALAATYEDGVETTYASGVYSVAGNSIPALLGITDYFDYYWRKSWRLSETWCLFAVTTKGSTRG